MEERALKSSNGMTDKRLLTVGAVSTAATALCCFTPIVVIALGIIGLSAMVGWLDCVLFPALLGFLGLTLYALRRRRSA